MSRADGDGGGVDFFFLFLFWENSSGHGRGLGLSFGSLSSIYVFFWISFHDRRYLLLLRSCRI